MSKGFEVKPVKHYDGARYPSAYRNKAIEEEELVREKPGPLKVLGLAIIILGLAIGLISCWGDLKFKPEHNPGTVDAGSGDGGNGDAGGDDGGDIILGEMVECTPGDIMCADDATVMVCNEDQYFDYNDCDAYCEETNGDGWYSAGCDANAEDPCQCFYDIIDGDVAECTPGDVYCSDESTLATCNDDHWSYSYTDCNTWCEEAYGYGAYSLGCDAALNEPCNCEYDIIGGVMAECTPGEIQCQDTSTLMTCNDDYYFDSIDCNTYCQQQSGDPNAYSNGCVDDPDDPCQCQYDIVDGGIGACTPGEIWCSDEYTLAQCEDWEYTYTDCNTYCTDTYGEGSYSLGCDAMDENNPCGCKEE